MAKAACGAAKMPDTTECPICLETFKEPKLLPCSHTFCLQCLSSYFEGKDANEMSCPLCRKVFMVPSGGISNLQNNFFICQLMHVNNNSSVTTGAPASAKQTPCELCSDSKDEVPSTSYCIECDQHICERCSVMHKKQKVSKLHQVIQNADIPISAGRIKSAGNYCDQHPSEENRLYCYDCKKIMCHVCVSKHNLHKLSDIGESAKEFIKQIRDGTEKVTEYAIKKQKEMKELETEKNTFLEKVAFTESNIAQKYDDLISLMLSHRSQLMEELNEYKEKLLKQIENKKEEVERQWVIMEGFKAYCEQIISKGTVYDISRIAQDLHARVEEFGKIQDEPDCNKISGVDITFIPSLAQTDGVNNLIGELTFTAEDESRLNISSSLDNPRLLGVIPGGRCIRGLTVLDSQLFVVRNESSQLSVYNTYSLTLTHDITITDSSRLEVIVASPRYNCLYISDIQQNVVYRYNLSDQVIISWFVGGKCAGLSLTSTHNVLATLIHTKEIKEYTPDGSLVREISLDSSIEDPWHSIQLSSGQFVICHGSGGSVHRVCIVDTSGCILQFYGGPRGSGLGQLYAPRYLAVDTHGNILVANYGNSSVMLLSRSLTHLGYITIPGHTLSGPWALHLDLLTRRLYIGEYTSTGRVFELSV